MPYDIQVEDNGFFVALSGTLIFDDIAEANDKIIDSAQWEAHRYQIWSFLTASALQDSKKYSRLISKVDERSVNRTHAHAIKIAFINTNAKTEEFLLAYMDSLDDSLIKAQIFETETEARSWVKR